MKYFYYLLFIQIVWSCGPKETSEGDGYFDSGAYEKAIVAYSNYLSTKPDHAKTLYNRGRAYEEIGESEKAKADFEQLIKLDPKYINAYLSLAKIAYSESNYNQVLHYAGKATELNENSAQGHFLSARASHQQGYVKVAMESYNNAISIDKDFGEAYLYRGALKVGTNKMRSACEDFKLAQLLQTAGSDDAISKYCN
ncbi:MAG: tetratricopeptide repeat protein [Bacteroidota bacterium]